MEEVISMKLKKPDFNIKEYLRKMKVDRYLKDLELKKYFDVFQQKRITRNTVKKIVTPLFGEEPVYIEKITNGNIYKVYKAILKSGGWVIVRISQSPENFNYFLKEQWATKKAIEQGIPAAEILEVGNTIVPHPYMVVRETHGIPGNRYEGDRTNMLKQIGEYAAKINQIPTNGYGEYFDWSNNLLSRKESWQEYLEKDLNVDHIIELYEKANILTPENHKKFVDAVNNIKKMKFEPRLSHGDLLPKNVIVDREGNIAGIIDWEAAKSTHAPLWELSTILNNVAPEERKLVIEGYGLTEDEFKEMEREIDALYLIKKSDMVSSHMLNNENDMLEKLKTKFNAILDKH